MAETSIKDLAPGKYYVNPVTYKAIEKVCEKQPIAAAMLLGAIKLVPNELINPGKLVKIEGDYQ